jgi:hypothetical protein
MVLFQLYCSCIAENKQGQHPKRPVACRFDLVVKQALSISAEREERSMANMMEWLIRKQCEKEGLDWPPLGASETGADPLPAATRAKKAKTSPVASRTSKQSKAALSGKRKQ